MILDNLSSESAVPHNNVVLKTEKKADNEAKANHQRAKVQLNIKTIHI